MAVIKTNSKNIDQLTDRLSKRYERCIKQASATSLSRIAGRARKQQQKLMPRYISDPTPFTVRGVRFTGAKRSEPISKMCSAVYINKTQSAYLNPLIVGETLTELYNRSPIISPVTSNLAKKGYGIGVKLNKFGNIPALKSGKIQKVIDHPNTFVIDLPGNGQLSAGIYYRNKNGTIDKLFSFDRDSRREAQYPFSDIALDVWDDGFADLYRDSLRDCLRN